MPEDDAKVVLTDLYEAQFGISNYFDPNKSVIESVLHQPCEEVWLNSGLRDLVEEFAVYNLGELFNISLTEFLTMPRPHVSMIRSIKDSVLKKRDAIVAAVERGVGKDAGGKM